MDESQLDAIIKSAQRQVAAVVIVGLCAILGIAFVAMLVIASAVR